MITTERTITICGDKSKIDEPILLYRGDFEVQVKFKIFNIKYKFQNGLNLISSENASHGQLAILGPRGQNIFSNVEKCVEGTLSFVITKVMIDELKEVGKYSFQVRLFDNNKSSRVTIPPVEFGIIVGEPVASEDTTEIVDEALVGYSMAKVTNVYEEPSGPTFSDDSYNPTRWELGDRITSDKLNKIEEALYVINEEKNNLSKDLKLRITSNFNVLDATKASKNELEVERKRIDSLVKTGDEQTEGNAELIDIRLAENGVGYETAGESVREQFKNIKDIIVPHYYPDFEKFVKLNYANPTSKRIEATFDTIRLTQIAENYSGNGGFTMPVNEDINTISFTVEHVNFGLTAALYFKKGRDLAEKYVDIVEPVSSELKTRDCEFILDWGEINEIKKNNGYTELVFLLWNSSNPKPNGYCYAYDIKINGFGKLSNVYEKMDKLIMDIGNTPIQKVINDKKVYKTSDAKRWSGSSNMVYENGIISFSNSTAGKNSGCIYEKLNILSKNDVVKIRGRILSLEGTLSLNIHFKTLYGNQSTYHTFKIFSSNHKGLFVAKVSINDLVNKYGDIDLETIDIIFSNNASILSVEMRDIEIYIGGIYNGETLEDALSDMNCNVPMNSISKQYNYFAKTLDVIGWSTGDITVIDDKTIHFNHSRDGGNSGFRSDYFTSSTNFVIVEGNVTSMSSINGSKMQVALMCYEKDSDTITYITTSLVDKVGEFRDIIDLNYHVVYNNLDLSKPIAVLFGSIGNIDMEIKNFVVYEDALLEHNLISDSLMDTCINFNTEINQLKSAVSKSNNRESMLVSPNGNRFILQVSNNGVLTCIPTIPNKTLFIGNSLLNGFGTFGMCATNSRNDYYYHVTEYVKRYNQNAKFEEIGGYTFEKCETQSAVNDWISENILMKNTDYDLVIVQLGDNVNNLARQSIFKTSAKQLLRAIREHIPNARVCWVGEWYYSEERQNIIREACSATGSVFVDISGMRRIEEYCGQIGMVITRDDGTTFTVDDSGVASHPGDLGMKAVADAIINELFEKQ